MARMSAASPFNPRLVVGMVGAGILAFAALLLLLAYGGGLGAPRGGGGANVQSVAATGFKGLEQLVRASYNTEMIRDPDDLDSDVLLVVTVEERTTAADYREMLRRRAGRPTLIILPKWVTRPNP